ncbi:2'-5' RNA ligase family protein [Qipengyuania gaetbuli]|uniref:2'-5' RNA ligase family protein n=1 Tax=Qipengyuania gaetbuli TaxID=266952 RepID=UPI001CFC4878|nr:2'-5' RNA ligase family protein [Qipengyuania gaetbuli]
MSGSDAPLILTAELPPDLHRRYTDLRTAHFPPERNYLEAHVTLFHALPAHCEDELRRYLARLTGEIAPVRGQVEGLMPLGGGTAIKLSSPDMLALRDEIAEHFRGMLTNQDQHRPRLHVTIQNKVTGKEAQALQAQLAGTIEPRPFSFAGLALHAYRGGPWEFIRRFAFRGK